LKLNAEANASHGRTSGSIASFVLSNIIDRASATRFFMPPDNSEGKQSSTPYKFGKKKSL